MLELPEGHWRGELPRGRLRIQVVGISRSSIPGWVVISGWRQFDHGAEPKLCRVVARAEVVSRASRGGR